MMRYQIEPLVRWPYPPTRQRKPNPFRAKFDQTLKELGAELEHLGMTGALAVQVVTDDVNVRQDGMLRARAVVRHPGVILSFQSRHGPLSYPCDTFAGSYYGDPPDWQINVRAIAVALEALRKVDRYGVGSHGEQYAGWRAIEAPASPFASKDAAYEWLRRFTGIELTTSGPPTDADYRALLRVAARLAHPDVGGEPDDWTRVDAARQLLRAGGVS